MKMIVFATALMIGSVSFAQEKEKSEKTEHNKEMGEHKKLTPEERAQRLTTKMTEKLKLTPEQSSKISDINVGIAKKNEGIRANTSMAKEEKAKIIKSNHDARLMMYKDVLTAEQMTQYEAWEAAKKEKHQENKGKGKGKAKGKGKTAPSKETETETEESEEL
jgi:Spy/CpxP family protein refolding chaperone